jgi:hypothetical protein
MRVVSITVVVALAGTIAAPLACKKDEPPPPLPSSAPAATPTPQAPVELAPEPVAPAASDAGPPKKMGTGSGSSLKKCCAALRQNAESAPEPNKGYMLQAAAMCDGMAASGQSGSIAGALQGMLRGAGMPASCK